MTASDTPGPVRNRPHFRAAVATATVLLVDDDHDVRTIARLFLQRSGYTVLDAATGAEALRLLAGQVGPIHLLVTDLSMPGMDGVRLAEAVHELRPGMRVLYLSGYGAGDARAPAMPEGVALLEKPFTADALSNKVHEMLDQSRQAQFKR